MQCFENIIGTRSCGEFKYYLDDYGFSLFRAANIADEAFLTGKNLIKKNVELAIKDVISDIHFDGFTVNKILSNVSFGSINKSCTFTGEKSISLKLDGSCETSTLYFNRLSFSTKTAGSVKVELISDTALELYNDNVDAEKEISIQLNQNVPSSIIIKITTDAELYCYDKISSCQCNNNKHYIVDSEDNNYMVSMQFHIRCDISEYLCNFIDIIAPAIIYKTLGKLYNSAYNTDSFNNWINSQQDKILQSMVYYDSEYLIMTDLQGKSTRIKGQYQLEIEKLSKILPKPNCKCCMDCNDSTGWIEQIVLP